MKRLLLVSLLALPSCKGISAIASGDPDSAEPAIAATETAVRTFGDMLIPGAGGALAVLFGVGARAYVKRKKKPAA